MPALLILEAALMVKRKPEIFSRNDSGGSCIRAHEHVNPL
jgi:hypothetical protein